ncbi:hypothetical protein [Capnocytophaga genosp. AHN8471]|uniref:hypothetical protein n=1 Tax=Capnocytophaga genosp. AHN8471 TaxID=327574 RepID=UPI0019327DA1|nr:hypothetical protein [Capnocytophaga genosp. AHN8471]MBM0660053.1 hypothetical protein [Capnocytophaga genosp. AHN8471]
MEQLLKSICLCVAVGMMVSCNIFKSSNNMNAAIEKYQYLHENLGSKDYEVVEIIPRTQEVKKFRIDTIAKTIIVSAVAFEEWRKERSYLKLDFEGNIIGHPDGGGFLLKDGTIIDEDKGYCKSIINDDMTWYPLIQLPFEFDTRYYTEAYKKYVSQDYDNWLKIFKEYYDKAEYVYLKWSGYYFKYRNQWYWMLDDIVPREKRKEFHTQYPARETASRFIEPYKGDPFYPVKNEDNYAVSIEDVDVDVDKKGNFFKPIHYTAGSFYYNLRVSDKDTIFVKRYAAYEPASWFINIPKSIGGKGREVIFIQQDPNTLYPNQSFGGLYVIRPRKKQPQLWNNY